MMIEYARIKTASSFLTSAKMCEASTQGARDITQLTRFVRHEMFRERVSYARNLLGFSWQPEGLQQFSQRFRNAFLINVNLLSPK